MYIYKNIDEVIVGDEVTLNLRELYNHYPNSDYITYIQFGKIVCSYQELADERHDYYDLYIDGALACMDGETCEIVAINNDVYTLLNANGEHDTEFKLTKKEFEIAYC